MPNGGYPFCAGCWFNLSNQGEDGWRSEGSLSGWFWRPRNPRKDPPEDFCEIRGVELTDTGGYPCCANHPFFRVDRDPVPIGPLWQSFTGPSDADYIVAPSPDTEPIRQHLLHLLKELFTSRERPEGYGSRSYEFLGDTIIRQLVEFGELRAIPILKQMSEMDCALPDLQDESADWKTAACRMHFAEAARQALRELEESPAER